MEESQENVPWAHRLCTWIWRKNILVEKKISNPEKIAITAVTTEPSGAIQRLRRTIYYSISHCFQKFLNSKKNQNTNMLNPLMFLAILSFTAERRINNAQNCFFLIMHAWKQEKITSPEKDTKLPCKWEKRG